jgi:hypothetical protein
MRSGYASSPEGGDGRRAAASKRPRTESHRAGATERGVAGIKGRSRCDALPSAMPTLVTDSIGEVIAIDLVVRSAPGVGADSRILDQRLIEADLVYIIDGPVRADGYGGLLVAELVLAEPRPPESRLTDRQSPGDDERRDGQRDQLWLPRPAYRRWDWISRA